MNFFFWFFVYANVYCVGAEVNTLMSISDGLEPYNFLLQDVKDEVYERGNGPKGVFPARVGICLL